MLNVKWKGYDDPADQTLEPEEGLLYEGLPTSITSAHQLMSLNV